MTETSEISIHAVRVFTALEVGTWMTSMDLATEAQVAPRTARLYAKRFVDAGIADLAEVFPRHHYRLSRHAEKRNKAYLQRLKEARDVFNGR